jgi:peptidoglycan/xylan/chitin deacetylase (PgdA/CDA1 family)
MSRLSLILILGILATELSAIAKASVSPVAIIRMDDIQEYYCDAVVKYIVDTVNGLNVPISLGFIANGLDQDPSGDAYYKSLSKNSLVEIASHSFSHLPFQDKPLAWQTNDLSKANDMIAKVTTVTPKTFITPLNVYDTNTPIAMKSNGLSIMSAECSWDVNRPGQVSYCLEGGDVKAPNITWNGVYMLSAGAVLGGDEYWEDTSLPASTTDAMNWMNAQIKNQGFTVLMLHPFEFTTDESACSVDQIDRKKINVLTEVIQQGLSNGWRFMTFQQGALALSTNT